MTTPPPGPDQPIRDLRDPWIGDVLDSNVSAEIKVFLLQSARDVMDDDGIIDETRGDLARMLGCSPSKAGHKLSVACQANLLEHLARGQSGQNAKYRKRRPCEVQHPGTRDADKTYQDSQDTGYRDAEAPQDPGTRDADLPGRHGQHPGFWDADQIGQEPGTRDADRSYQDGQDPGTRDAEAPQRPGTRDADHPYQESQHPGTRDAERSAPYKDPARARSDADRSSPAGDRAGASPARLSLAYDAEPKIDRSVRLVQAAGYLRGVYGAGISDWVAEFVVDQARARAQLAGSDIKHIVRYLTKMRAADKGNGENDLNEIVEAAQHAETRREARNAPPPPPPWPLPKPHQPPLLLGLPSGVPDIPELSQARAAMAAASLARRTANQKGATGT